MDDQAIIKEPDAAVDEAVVWSIGVYSGKTPFDLKPAAANPVMTAAQVTDLAAEFVADPFMMRTEPGWHMFFEVMNRATGKGEVGFASSGDGLSWEYGGVALREPFHLSYPYVFEAGGEFFMIPESFQADAIRLYRGDPFPHKWSLVGSIMEGRWIDSSVVFHDGRWWMFTCPYYSDDDALALFYADSIRGPWHSHPLNPIVKNNNQIARPGGRVIVMGERVVRFTQACYPDYGMSVRAFEARELTTTTYREREVGRSPVLSAGEQDWNRSGMHHIDPHRVNGGWLACVDGWRVERPGLR